MSFVCQKCRHAFTTKQNLQRHAAIKKPCVAVAVKGGSKHPCECGREFSSSSNRDRHRAGSCVLGARARRATPNFGEECDSIIGAVWVAKQLNKLRKLPAELAAKHLIISSVDRLFTRCGNCYSIGAQGYKYVGGWVRADISEISTQMISRAIDFLFMRQDGIALDAGVNPILQHIRKNEASLGKLPMNAILTGNSFVLKKR